MGQTRNAYGILIGKPQEKAPHEGPKRRWEDSFKMNLSERGCKDVVQDRDQWRAFLSTAITLRNP
jgi:hypothetical protein